MKSTAKKLAVCAAALCLLACGTAVSAAAASPVSGLALSGVAMPWDQDVPAESIEAGSYTANMLLGSSQQLSPGCVRATLPTRLSLSRTILPS